MHYAITNFWPLLTHDDVIECECSGCCCPFVRRILSSQHWLALMFPFLLTWTSSSGNCRVCQAKRGNAYMMSLKLMLQQVCHKANISVWALYLFIPDFYLRYVKFYDRWMSNKPIVKTRYDSCLWCCVPDVRIDELSETIYIYIKYCHTPLYSIRH